MPAKSMEAIRGLERDRFRAMVDSDGPALDALLAENVSYVHTNGKRETKRQFIDAITAGRRRYRQIEIQSQDVIVAGKDTCLVSGRALIEMESKNGALLFPIAYTAVHVQTDGQWLLLALQATRVALE
ncbi:nuclear transport factor 2 family protein [Caballeronia sp. LP006]|uniref:nuclear transport factor 2 family protein n=1 Tax=unclassified Caballeronia TaxID=2646786 RepID=UPI002028C96D|nr:MULTISPECIES: nuclear transport factor 2 family protein [unclassified Caballeronia]MDR5770410.1 nuclear transport factor 2 family protein [Caballeronia sp. LZ002]MDR5803191.1 nuclear transport factor 2 family protein [Caballeronia sp. LZ001]MDR5830153.1 nuclear transport factor 2 family protein [Caballeronia sp. LP006]MDR5845847.1 nuclear transport factor 2 family protein [Caballeronia sp. LZ003]